MTIFPGLSAAPNKDDVTPRLNFGEFFTPTAEELARLIHKNTVDCVSTLMADERINHFARLLNRGSSLE